MNVPKRPSRPPGALICESSDVVVSRPVLWRIHRTVGDHVLGWSALRHWGPAATMRFDPHPEPVGEHPAVGVTYASTDLATAVAEVFQTDRRIDTHTGHPKATAWQPVREIRMLNLTEDWALRNGASHALTSGPRAACRNWARAIRERWPDLDGLTSLSTMTGRPNVALWSPAESSFPTSPDFSESLAAGPMWATMQAIIARYPTYRLI